MKFTRKTYLNITLPVALLCFVCPILCGRDSKCRVIFDIGVCSSNSQNSSNAESSTCHRSLSGLPDVCHKSYIIDFVQLEPYTPEIVIDALKTCCGSCLRYTSGETYTSISKISPRPNATSHFIFPALGRSTAKKLYGYYFIPLIEPPSIYYVTLKGDSVMANLIMKCLDMWPLLINCSFMVAIAGFLGWLMETWGNTDDFPRPFINGWFEGIWWAYISMTTVGYGDKSPKSFPARLLAVVWILIGITCFSMVTAMLSSELTKANSLPPPEVEGAKVGVLPNRLYDSIVVAKHGGTLVNVKSENTLSGIYELVDQLKRKEINGFAIDRYVILMLYRHLESSNPGFVNFLKTQTIRTELSYTGEALSYGFLVKDADDYDFLVDFVQDNNNILNACNTLLINDLSNKAKDSQDSTSIFEVSGGAFWPTFTFLVSTIALICCFGFCYEIHRRLSLKKNDGVKNQHGKIPPRPLSLTNCLMAKTYYIDDEGSI